MTPLLVALLLLAAAAAGTAVVLVREPLHQALLLGLHSFSLVLLLLALRAPDVALAYLVVGVVAEPLMFLVAIANARRRAPPQ
ncbi:MAG TPA: hydrogenase subunit MbhD domain-containing protein [Burkholderiaceae bacterium]|jgi:energy-converting hydrogenase B subunit D|nr:hydrogenase subunit MbhD domain-containing protein [Burkholderiaceae bacterium]